MFLELEALAFQQARNSQALAASQRFDATYRIVNRFEAQELTLLGKRVK